MKISHITIENFRGIHSLDIDCSNRINVFIGENGVGKTTILTAVQYLLSWFTARFKNEKGRGKSLSDRDITKGQERCKLSLNLDNKTNEWSLLKYAQTYRKTGKEESDMQGSLVYANEIVERYKNKCSIPIVVGYGVDRAINSADIPKHLHKQTEIQLEDIYKDAFQVTVNFRTFFEWYRAMESDDDYFYRHDGEMYNANRQLQAVRNAFERAMPGYRNLHIRRRPTALVLEKNGNEFYFQELSDGEKCYFSLIADIARRLAIANPDIDEPLNGEGVVLIDEIDLHLHPKWQVEVLTKLTEIFPNCQFFITTHSPFVVSNITREDYLFVFSEGNVVKVDDRVYGKKIDELLLEYFSMKGLRNPLVQSYIDEVWGLIRNNEYDTEQYRKSFNWLKDKLPVSDIEFARIKLELKKRENEKNK